jgi:amino acid transporter
MFAYLGLESATIPAGDVDDAKRTIPRSTILGIAIAALLYVLGTIAVMGVVPREQLVRSVARAARSARVPADHGSCPAFGEFGLGHRISALLVLPRDVAMASL